MRDQWKKKKNIHLWASGWKIQKKNIFTFPLQKGTLLCVFLIASRLVSKSCVLDSDVLCTLWCPFVVGFSSWRSFNDTGMFEHGSVSWCWLCLYNSIHTKIEGKKQGQTKSKGILEEKPGSQVLWALDVHFKLSVFSWEKKNHQEQILWHKI